MPHTGVMSRITSVFKLSRSEGAHLSDMKAGRYPSLELEEKLGLEGVFPSRTSTYSQKGFLARFVCVNSLMEMQRSTQISLLDQHKVLALKVGTLTHQKICS